MVIKVFIASSSGQLSIKKQQQDLLGLLNVLHIDFEQHDIAVNEDDRRYMREHVPPDHRPPSGNPLPPQVFNGEKYCGDYESFFDAKETNSVYTFLGLIPPPGSKEAAALAEQSS